MYIKDRLKPIFNPVAKEKITLTMNLFVFFRHKGDNSLAKLKIA